MRRLKFGSVSNLKYESVRIDFKAVVFIRANLVKNKFKKPTDGSGWHVNFIQKQCTFPKVGRSRKIVRDQYQAMGPVIPQKLTLTDLIHTLTVMFIVVSLVVVSGLGTK